MRQLSRCNAWKFVVLAWFHAGDSMGGATAGRLMATHVDTVAKGALEHFGSTQRVHKNYAANEAALNYAADGEVPGLLAAVGQGRRCYQGKKRGQRGSVSHSVCP